MSGGARIVYSTATGRKPPEETDVPLARRVSPAEHDLRVRRDRKGRRGKTVTCAGPFRLRRADVAEILRDLKRRLGTGGGLTRDSATEGEAFVIELQGDRVEEVLSRLTELGFRARR